MIFSDLRPRGSMVKRYMQSLPLTFGKSKLLSSAVLCTVLTVPPPEAKAPDHFRGPVWLGIIWIFFRPHVMKAALKYSVAALVMTRYECPGVALFILLLFLRATGAEF